MGLPFSLFSVSYSTQFTFEATTFISQFMMNEHFAKLLSNQISRTLYFPKHNRSEESKPNKNHNEEKSGEFQSSLLSKNASQQSLKKIFNLAKLDHVLYCKSIFSNLAEKCLLNVSKIVILLLSSVS